MEKGLSEAGRNSMPSLAAAVPPLGLPWDYFPTFSSVVPAGVCGSKVLETVDSPNIFSLQGLYTLLPGHM